MDAARPREIPPRKFSLEQSLHHALVGFNRARLRPRVPNADWRGDIEREARMRLLEGEFVEREREQVSAAAEGAPSDPDAFVAWFEALRESGAGQNDPLFPWLSERATLEQMRWFLRQEIAGEAGFDDLVALTQVHMMACAKLELARNYWDEMGQGNACGMHGPMLGRLAVEMGIESSGGGGGGGGAGNAASERNAGNARVVWESLALGNLMVGLAANRRYAYQSVGALGVIELTAPGRAAHVNAGLKRLGIAGEARRYFALHATLDVKHSVAWNREVLRPIVAQAPESARAIAEGALLRLGAGARCFARYRREFGFVAPRRAESAA